MDERFRGKITKKIYSGDKPKNLNPLVMKRAVRKLQMVLAATRITDLEIPPSNHLELLEPKQNKIYSIKVQDQYRICFYWNKKTGRAEDIEFTDYH